jgi:hypothetical protein
MTASMASTNHQLAALSSMGLNPLLHLHPFLAAQAVQQAQQLGQGLNPGAQPPILPAAAVLAAAPPPKPPAANVAKIPQPGDQEGGIKVEGAAAGAAGAGAGGDGVEAPKEGGIKLEGGLKSEAQAEAGKVAGSEVPPPAGGVKSASEVVAGALPAAKMAEGVK